MRISSTPTLLLSAALLLAAACEQGKAGEGQDVTESEDSVSSGPINVVGELEYGESGRALYRYRARQNGYAYTFRGRAGDQVKIDVASTQGDAVAWLLDSSFTELATNDDTSEDNVNSHIEATLPSNTVGEAQFYILFRDYDRESHYFTVAISADRPASKVITLTEDRCASGRNRYLANGVIAAPEDLALDAYCSELLFSKKAPDGFVVIFGSSRLGDGTPEYTNVRSFANQWSLVRPDLPILTGGGPGIMEGGNRGAHEAGAVSLGISTYFRGAEDALNAYVTDGYMFTDFAVRERAMLNYAKAAVVYPGGVGTAWELFMTLSQVQTKRLNPMPIIVVGQEMATAFRVYMQWMADRGTISPGDLMLFTVVSTPEEAVAALQAALPRN